MKTRRHFIQHCTSALLGAAVLPASASAVGSQPSLAGFTAVLGTKFTLSTPSGQTLSVVLEKAEMSFASQKTVRAAETSFWLQFASRSTQALEQGTYSFSHPQLGEQPIFVVPHISSESGAVNYAAVFNLAPALA